MEGNLQLMLTKEQAALLAPILQQILPVNSLQVVDKFEAGQPQPGQTLTRALPSVVPELPSAEAAEVQQKEILTNSNDDVCDESSSIVSGAGNFTVSDLLQKKKRNAKSTRAQNFLNVRIVLSFIVVGTEGSVTDWNLVRLLEILESGILPRKKTV